jgi:hypothetical protein
MNYIWINFKDDEEITDPYQDDETARKVISQDPAAQNLYSLLREHANYSIQDAILQVLHAQLGEPPPVIWPETREKRSEP